MPLDGAGMADESMRWTFGGGSQIGRLAFIPGLR